MSIVRMKRLRLIALSQERDELLARLLHVGCVEVTEPESKLNDPEWTALLTRDNNALLDVKSRAGALKSALDALKKYAPEKGGLFVKRAPILESEFFSQTAMDSALKHADEINALTHKIAQLQSKENKLNNTKASLAPWATLDLPLELQETETTAIQLGVCPAAADVTAMQTALSEVAGKAELYEVSVDREQHYLLLMCHKEELETALDTLRVRGFALSRFKDVVGTAAENIQRIEAELAEIETERAAAVEGIVSHKDARKDLQICQDRVNQDIQKQQARDKLMTNGTIVFLEGWAAETGREKLEAELQKFTCAYELAEPSEEEEPPTLLKNPPWMTCINMVTEMYSLPAYRGGIDPNPLIFWFFILFFGFMFADLAYGIIIFLVSYLVTKNYKPKGTMGYMFHLGQYLGISTAIVGLLTGGCFGDGLYQFTSAFFPEHVMSMPALISPMEEPMTIMVIALVLGGIHMVFGQCIHIYMEIRDGHPLEGFLDVVPWWIVFAGVAVFFFAGTPAVIVAGFLALLLTQGRHKKGFFGKLFGGISSWYDITSWLGDILSYCRLMALMLATGVIAQVFNILATMPGEGMPKPIGILIFLVIFLVGNGFNIGINLIGTYVHAARLQYLEFFGKFYKEGGVPFKPLKYNTKFVDVTTESGEVIE